MLDSQSTILYVDDPPASAGFYADLFGCEAGEVSPTFALFVLPAGRIFGLWSRHTVEPAATAAGGGAELAFRLRDENAVDRLFAQWSQRGLRMLQSPIRMDFGYTFVALDPDGHRLRAYAMTE